MQNQRLAQKLSKTIESMPSHSPQELVGSAK
jgi:hypothetical protein